MAPALRRLLGAIALLAVGGALAHASDPALPSPLAARSLLLGVARAGERLVAVGERGHVVLSDDGGSRWRQARLVPTRATLTAVCFVDSREGWAVGHDAVILHTRDAGESWELQHARPEDDAPLLSVWFEGPGRGIAVGAFSLVLGTEDAGRTWQRLELDLSADPGADGEALPEDHHLNQIFPGPAGSLFIAAEFGSVFRSLDRGRSWQRLQLPYRGSLWGGLALDEQTVLVFGMRGHLFRSDDLGRTWQAVESGTDQSLQSARRLPDGRVVIVGLGGTVLTSRDGGRSFAAGVAGDRLAIADVAEAPAGGLLLFGEGGVRPRPPP